MTSHSVSTNRFRSAVQPVVLVGLLVLSGCTLSGAEPQGVTFVLPTTDTVDCQEHQETGPSSAYAGDADSDTVAMLDLLRYWGENGDKPYCDGEPPTEVDQQWAQTVERLREPGPRVSLSFSG